MKLDEVTKVAQVTNVNEVNELLAKGYRIIKIFSTKTNDEQGLETIKPTYIVGLRKE